VILVLRNLNWMLSDNFIFYLIVAIIWFSPILFYVSDISWFFLR